MPDAEGVNATPMLFRYADPPVMPGLDPGIP